MTDKVKQRAANAIMKSFRVFSEDTSLKRYVPQIYVVGDSLYWFLNAARRAAYCEKKPIEALTFLEAYMLTHGGKQPPKKQYKMKIGLDQTGEVYWNYLFIDSLVPVDSPRVKMWEPKTEA